MIGDMSEVIEAFESVILIKLSGNGSLIDGKWVKTADTEIITRGALLPINVVLDYSELKYADSTAVLFMRTNIKGHKVSDNTDVVVNLEMEDIFTSGGKEYRISTEALYLQDTNVVSYGAKEVRPK